MSGAPAAPVTTITATSPCRTTDGVTVTFTAAAAGPTTPNIAATTTTTLIRNDPRNAMPRLYAPKGKARRIELHAGHAEGGRGGERPPGTHILCGDSRRPKPQSRGPIEKTQSARISVSSREGGPRPSRPVVRTTETEWARKTRAAA